MALLGPGFGSQGFDQVSAGVVGSSEVRVHFQVHGVDGRIYVLASVELMVLASSRQTRVSVSDVLIIFQRASPIMSGPPLIMSLCDCLNQQRMAEVMFVTFEDYIIKMSHTPF